MTHFALFVNFSVKKYADKALLSKGLYN